MQKSINQAKNLSLHFAITISEDWLEFDLGDTSFALLRSKQQDGEVKPQKTRIMLQIDNLDTMKQKLESCNVKIVRIREEKYGRLLTFEDPNGHWLELFEPSILSTNHNKSSS